MQAAFIEQYGNEDNLIIGQRPLPEVADNQVLIKVHASAVNPVDWMVREGFFKEHNVHTLPLILGWDVAGEIAQLGRDVKHLKMGQAVFAYTPILKQGGYAQYIAVDADLVANKPQSLDLLTSAAVPLAATTAWQALTKAGQLKQGDRILIHNASGGVGMFAVQMAKALGAYVIGTASKASQAFVESLGVDEFIDYQTEDFTEKLSELDFVLAAVGGNQIVERSLSVVKKSGYLISLLDEIPDELVSSHQVIYQRLWVTPDANDLTTIANLIDNGKIKVVIDSSYSLEEIKQAHQRSQSKRAKGKIVLRIPHHNSEV